MCRWLELVAEADRRGDWAEEGRGSCAEWLAWRCGVAARSAREHVRVARALEGLPLIHTAFADGVLSYAKVRALTRVATAETEGELLELASALTASQLERSVRSYRRVTTAQARDLQEQAFLGFSWNDEGSLELRGRLAPEDASLVLRALEAMRDSLWQQARGSAEPRPALPTANGGRASVGPRPARQASNAEALVALAENALASTEAARTGGERYQIVVHADEAVLADDGADGGCELDDGPGLAPETARRLACDASLVREGRRTRTIPPALRRALRRRDRGCRFPGCENRRFVDAHHVHHWANGGATTLRNLVLLCRRHHRAVHEGGYRVDHDVRFWYPWGEEIPTAPPLPRGRPDGVVEGNGDVAIGPSTYATGAGDPLDVAGAVDALLAIERRAERSASEP